MRYDLAFLAIFFALTLAPLPASAADEEKTPKPPVSFRRPDPPVSFRRPDPPVSFRRPDRVDLSSLINPDQEKPPASHILDLAGQGKIQVEARGADIQSVTIKVRNLSKQRVHVRIPAGTYLACQNVGFQNMIISHTATMSLWPNASNSVRISALCADQTSHVPEHGHVFTLSRAAPQRPLQQLIRVLEKSDAAVSSEQAAVWIVTDDASYKSFGAVSGPITKCLAIAQGMRLCDYAGIDLRQRAIWSAREHIYRQIYWQLDDVVASPVTDDPPPSSVQINWDEIEIPLDANEPHDTAEAARTTRDEAAERKAEEEQRQEELRNRKLRQITRELETQRELDNLRKWFEKMDPMLAYRMSQTHRDISQRLSTVDSSKLRALSKNQLNIVFILHQSDFRPVGVCLMRCLRRMGHNVMGYSWAKARPYGIFRMFSEDIGIVTREDVLADANLLSEALAVVLRYANGKTPEIKTMTEEGKIRGEMSLTGMWLIGAEGDPVTPDIIIWCN